jgi:L-glutamine-phosphate cytidylyltransferase
LTTGIVVAAGLGSRMPNLTKDRPKAMLPIGGRPLIHNTLDRLRQAGCDRLVVIVGSMGETIDAPGAEIVKNTQYRDNNILHSLMYAREFMSGPTVVSYSDIWIEPSVIERLKAARSDIALAVDSDWQPYYDGRREHPLAEAESVYYDDAARIVQIGKHLLDTDPAPLQCGEFLGLWKMSGVGTERFVSAFDAVNRRVDPHAPFQHAMEWRRAYITDLIQDMVSSGTEIGCALVKRGWAELDTQEDFDRLPRVAQLQRLTSLVEHLENA